MAALEQAVALGPDIAVMRYTLADAYFRQGRRDEAIAMAEKALTSAEAEGHKELAVEIRRLLEALHAAPE